MSAKTEPEIRAEIAHCEQGMTTAKRQYARSHFATRLNTLRWVLGEVDEHGVEIESEEVSR